MIRSGDFQLIGASPLQSWFVTVVGRHRLRFGGFPRLKGIVVTVNQLNARRWRS